MTRSAYGLNFAGLGAPPELLNDPLPDAPTVTVRWHRAHPPDTADVTLAVDGGRATVTHPAGVRIELDRQRRTADFHGADVPSDQRAHPVLSPVAVLHNRWLGREVLHAAVLVVDGRAWAVFGEREAGKSSLAATAADLGVEVLSDDLAVLDGATVLGGPRCIDLRERPPGSTMALASSRGGTRHRVALPPSTMPAVPLAGWVTLRWSHDVDVRPMPGAQVLGELARQRTVGRLPSDEVGILDLATRPGLALHRPRDWSRAAAGVQALVDAMRATAAATDRARR